MANPHLDVLTAVFTLLANCALSVECRGVMKKVRMSLATQCIFASYLGVLFYTPTSGEVSLWVCMPKPKVGEDIPGKAHIELCMDQTASEPFILK